MPTTRRDLLQEGCGHAINMILGFRRSRLASGCIPPGEKSEAGSRGCATNALEDHWDQGIVWFR